MAGIPLDWIEPTHCRNYLIRRNEFVAAVVRYIFIDFPLDFPFSDSVLDGTNSTISPGDGRFGSAGVRYENGARNPAEASV